MILLLWFFEVKCSTVMSQFWRSRNYPAGFDTVENKSNEDRPRAEGSKGYLKLPWEPVAFPWGLLNVANFPCFFLRGKLDLKSFHQRH